MSFNYEKSAAAVTRLMARFGQAMTLKRSSSLIDPVTGDVSGTGNESYTLTGVMLNYPANLIDGTRITASDRRVIVGASVEPKLSDTLTVDGEDWSIQEVISSSPGGTPLRYEIRVRR